MLLSHLNTLCTGDWYKVNVKSGVDHYKAPECPLVFPINYRCWFQSWTICITDLHETVPRSPVCWGVCGVPKTLNFHWFQAWILLEDNMHYGSTWNNSQIHCMREQDISTVPISSPCQICLVQWGRGVSTKSTEFHEYSSEGYGGLPVLYKLEQDISTARISSLSQICRVQSGRGVSTVGYGGSEEHWISLKHYGSTWNNSQIPIYARTRYLNCTDIQSVSNLPCPMRKGGEFRGVWGIRKTLNCEWYGGSEKHWILRGMGGLKNTEFH